MGQTYQSIMKNLRIVMMSNVFFGLQRLFDNEGLDSIQIG